MSWLLLIQMISQSIRSIYDTFIYLFTGKTLFERIMSNRTLPYSLRFNQIKNSIYFTSTKNLNHEIEQTKMNRNKSLIHNQLCVVMHKLELYQKLIQQINEIRMTQVTSIDEQHIELFEKIWSRLVIQSNNDHEPMNMISKHWMKIGFQV